jgi:hypothetical protein
MNEEAEQHKRALEGGGEKYTIGEDFDPGVFHALEALATNGRTE